MISRLLVLTLCAAPETQELRFTDKAGEHLVTFTLSEVKSKKTKEGYSRSRDLLVTHTVGKKEIWRAKDFVQKCEFDLQLALVEGSLEVSDVDEDGEKEVSFLYRLGCRSDVSPDTMKLLMYEGSTKYALRGESKERVGETEYVGGTFVPDSAFDKAPAVFLDFATAKWKRLVSDAK